MTAIPRLRAYQGPAILSYGFRPFFLFGAAQAGLAIPIWLALFAGIGHPAMPFAPRDWHVHEMLYGYVPAVVTGFLLTAIPNWTGRLPIQGTPLAGLFSLWLAGRLVSCLGGGLPWGLVLAVDAAFLLAMAAAAAREIIAGRNWRNLKVVLLLTALACGNIGFHVETRLMGVADLSIRLGIGATVMLIMLIGGRIIPSFTRNWLARVNPGRLPVPPNRFDIVTMALGGVALAAWIALPFSPGTAALLVAAGLGQAFRLARWAGDRTLADRLVLVLHVGYAFVPLGFVLVGLASAGLLPASAGIHAWTGGAVGVMTLAVMTRASLGHTGQPLAASPSTQAIYAAAVVAALARVAAALWPEASDLLLALSGAAWVAAFGGFALAFGPLLCRPRGA